MKHDSDGAVTELSADGNSGVWYRLGTSVGSTWTLECGEGCVGCLDHASARLASHSELVRVPAGEFPDAVRVDYTCDCMDAGLVSEWFAEGVGLIKRLEQSIAGPIESVLLRANVGGIVLPDHPAATSLTLDETRISIAGSAGKPRITGAFRVHDQTSDSLTFEFEAHFKQPWLLATSVKLKPESVRAIYKDRWPVEQIPLSAKQMVGAHRQFVHNPESIQRLPELALLAGSILSFLAGTFPPTPTGFWDRQPKRTPGRFRRLLIGQPFPKDAHISGQLRVKKSVTAHLPKGNLARSPKVAETAAA